MLISARFERRSQQKSEPTQAAGLIEPRLQREVSLTFDDGPDPFWTPRVLDTLHSVRARATFFVVTPLARRYPYLISEMLRHGHTVELHCVEHVRHTDLNRDEIEEESRTGLRDLGSLGVRPRLWRTPWGITCPSTLEVTREFGLEVSGWTDDTHDWRGDSASTMLESIGPSLFPGSVILMHDGLGPGARRTGCEETVALIEPLVDRIRALGCELAPMKPALLTEHEASA